MCNLDGKRIGSGWELSERDLGRPEGPVPKHHGNEVTPRTGPPGIDLNATYMVVPTLKS